LEGKLTRHLAAGVFTAPPLAAGAFPLPPLAAIAGGQISMATSS